MKKITQKLYCPYSEVGVNEGILEICKEAKTEYPVITLNISVFDVNHAISFFIDPKNKINDIRISRYLHSGQFTLKDELSGIEYIQADE